MRDGRAEQIRSYKDLEVWQLAVELSVAVYSATNSFPREEMYGLSSQMRRSAVSIAANIEEGYGRESTASYIQFLRVSQGSAKELETHTIIADRIGYLGSNERAALEAQLNSVSRMLRALIRSLEGKI